MRRPDMWAVLECPHSLLSYPYDDGSQLRKLRWLTSHSRATRTLCLKVIIHLQTCWSPSPWRATWSVMCIATDVDSRSSCADQRCMHLQTDAYEKDHKRCSNDWEKIDDRLQMLMLGFAAAPALVELHVQLPNYDTIRSSSLVSATKATRASAGWWSQH